ncbi:MAG: arginine deiminase-related protein [Bacteroidota bacterium]
MHKIYTSHIMMVSPANFGHNEQTAGTNLFQIDEAIGNPDKIKEMALAEFNDFVDVLKKNGITVNVIYDTPEPIKPDAIFPNNWVSFHNDGTVVLYPMYSENRRWERRRSILELIGGSYEIKREVDFSYYEEEQKFLEGTGSMVWDKSTHNCFACLSMRTHVEVLQDFCEKMGYHLIRFESTDNQGFPIYHTNVMFSISSKYAILCLDSIRLEQEKEMIIHYLEEAGKEIISISMSQMFQFCGNVLELGNKQGESLLVMSEKAYLSFLPEQIQTIEKYSKIIHSPLSTIEKLSGGGARCMIAEIFLPVK